MFPKLILLAYFSSCFLQGPRAQFPVQPVGGGGDPIASCFSAFQSNAAFTSTRLGSVNDCLRYCYDKSTCQSVVWDQTSCLCYQFGQTARLNPGILLNRVGTAYYEKSCGTTNPNPNIINPPPSGKAACASIAQTVYFLATGTEILPTSSSIMTTYPEENRCISACTDYKSICWSVNIYPKNKTCVASSQILPPDGSGSSRSNPDSIYLEKFCLPSNAPAICSEQFFFLFPQKSLTEYSLSTVYTNTLADCAGTCSVTPGCKAGVYDSNSKVCVLKKETAVSSKTDLRPAAGNVYYFENGCSLANKVYRQSDSAVIYRNPDAVRQQQGRGFSRTGGVRVNPFARLYNN